MTPHATDARVSHRGQTTLPAALRRRWGVEEGGRIGIIDLGDVALVVPGGLEAARRALHADLSSHYDALLRAIDDPDLVTQ